MHFRTLFALVGGLFASGMFTPRQATSAIITWIGAPGVPLDWNNPNNWSSGTVPKFPNPDEARILNGGVAEIWPAGLPTMVWSMSVGDTNSASSGRVIVRNGGVLLVTSDSLQIGGSSAVNGGGTGVLDILEGGTVNLSSVPLCLGMGPTGNGTLNVSGGRLTLSSSSFAAIGYRGTGTVNQTGGEVWTGSPSGVVQLGRNTATAPSSGTYTLSGGKLAVTNLRFGQEPGTSGVSNNTFNLQGSGELIVKEIKILNPSATNTFNFTGGTLRGQLIGVPLTNTGGIFDPSLPRFDGGNLPDLVVDPVATATFSQDFGYTQAGTGRLTLHLRDTLQYDMVDVGANGTGTVTLGGFVDVNPLNGFDPGFGTFFDVVKADSLIFTAQVLGQTASGLTFAPSVIQGGDGRQVLRLTVIPEPGTGLLLGLAAVGVGFGRTRPRKSERR